MQSLVSVMRNCMENTPQLQAAAAAAQRAMGGAAAAAGRAPRQPNPAMVQVGGCVAAGRPSAPAALPSLPRRCEQGAANVQVAVISFSPPCARPTFPRPAPPRPTSASLRSTLWRWGSLRRAPRRRCGRCALCAVRCALCCTRTLRRSRERNTARGSHQRRALPPLAWHAQGLGAPPAADAFAAPQPGRSFTLWNTLCSWPAHKHLFPPAMQCGPRWATLLSLPWSG